MEGINFLVLGVATIIPLLVGFIWYNPKVFGAAWMQAAEVTEDKMQGANMLLIFGLTLVLSFILSFMLQTLVIHQYSLYGLLINDLKDNPKAQELFNEIMSSFGSNFRTFKHGALHGIICGITIVLPVMGINALFERKGWKYILINTGYWVFSLAIMGGIICKFS